MQKPRWVLIALSTLIGLAVIGLTFAAVVVREEGLEGLFDRKRKAVERVAPETLPILDKVEDTVIPARKK